MTFDVGNGEEDINDHYMAECLEVENEVTQFRSKPPPYMQTDVVDFIESGAVVNSTFEDEPERA